MQFFAIEPHFVRKGCDETPEIFTHFTPVFGDQSSFRAKGLCRTPTNRNFTPVFGNRTCERVAVRTVSLALPRAFKREIEKKERARGQESKRAREQEGKRECEDVKMRRCEDVRM